MRCGEHDQSKYRTLKILIFLVIIMAGVEPLRRQSSGMSVFPGTMWKMESSIMSVLGYQAKWKAKASWAQVFSSFIFLKTDDKWPSASNSRFHAFHTVTKWPLKLWIKNKNKNKTFPLLIIFLDALLQNKKLTNPILFLFSSNGMKFHDVYLSHFW